LNERIRLFVCDASLGLSRINTCFSSRSDTKWPPECAWNCLELVKRHEVPLSKKPAMKAAGELLSRPAAYRVAIAATDVALVCHYSGLNALGRGREVPHPSDGG
jgi:hypothetical protein